MKRTGIYAAGAVGALALAAVSMQASSPHAQGHGTASAPKVTVQHWAGGTYTPAAQSAHDASVHVTSLERSATRANGTRGLSAPARAARNIPVECGMRGLAPDAHSDVRQIPTTPANTSSNRRGA